MLTISFPSKTFVRECEDTFRLNETFEILVSAESGKINSVQRSIREMRGEASRSYMLFSLLWDKWRTIDLWVGLARPMAMDWRFDCERRSDLVVRVSPPLPTR
jgi:hypothetical protein